MTRAIVALLAVFVGTCSPAYAEPCRRAVHVEAGTAAPCTGDLLPTSEVLRLLLVEDTLDLRDAELVNERDLRAISEAEAAELLAVEQAARRACETQHAPPPARVPAWYQSPWLAGAVGVLAGSALVLGVVYALGAQE